MSRFVQSKQFRRFQHNVVLCGMYLIQHHVQKNSQAHSYVRFTGRLSRLTPTVLCMLRMSGFEFVYIELVSLERLCSLQVGVCVVGTLTDHIQCLAAFAVSVSITVHLDA